jgi:hypothetical protein
MADKKKVSIELPAPEFTTFDLVLTGTTPLITDSFSEPRKAAFARTQDGSAKQKPGPRDPDAEFHEAMYRTEDGRHGIPKLAFRKAFQAGAMRMTDVKGTVALAAFQINTADEVLPLVGPDPKMRTDHVVRVGRGNLVYRAEFWPWSVRLPIRLDHEVVSLEQFAHIVYKSGMGVGIGNWRPEKRGDFGCWTIEAIENVQVSHSEAEESKGRSNGHRVMQEV